MVGTSIASRWLFARGLGWSLWSVPIAIGLVFSRWGYLAFAVIAALATAALYAYTGQIVTFYGDGSVFVDTDPTHLGILVLLSLLMGLVLPLQWFALRRAAWGARQAGSGALGFVAGLGSLTCCSPLLLPSLLSFAGFSGSSLLTMNITFYRYFRPLAALSAALLLLSLFLAARDIIRACGLREGVHQEPPPAPLRSPRQQTH